MSKYRKNVETSHLKKLLYRNWQTSPIFTKACCTKTYPDVFVTEILGECLLGVSHSAHPLQHLETTFEIKCSFWHDWLFLFFSTMFVIRAIFTIVSFLLIVFRILRKCKYNLDLKFANEILRTFWIIINKVQNT